MYDDYLVSPEYEIDMNSSVSYAYLVGGYGDKCPACEHLFGQHSDSDERAYEMVPCSYPWEVLDA